MISIIKSKKLTHKHSHTQCQIVNPRSAVSAVSMLRKTFYVTCIEGMEANLSLYGMVRRKSRSRIAIILKMYFIEVSSLLILNMMAVAVNLVGLQTRAVSLREIGKLTEKLCANASKCLRSGIDRSPQRRHHLLHVNTTVMNYITEEWNQIMVMLSLQVVQN